MSITQGSSLVAGSFKRQKEFCASNDIKERVHEIAVRAEITPPSLLQITSREESSPVFNSACSVDSI
eukprot:scaffold10274_cov88-Skeletonema_dohrnii-CCMP3373.AAC.4